MYIKTKPTAELEFLTVPFQNRSYNVTLKESLNGLLLSLAEGGQLTVTLNKVKHFSSDIFRMTCDAHRLMTDD